MAFEFIDFSTKAKELGLTDGNFRAKVLSAYDSFPAFVHLSWISALGTQEDYLPPWSADEFPHIRWEDQGSRIGRRGISSEELVEWRRPRYQLTGWVIVARHTFSEIHARGGVDINDQRVWLCTPNLETNYALDLQVTPDREWIESGGYEEGGYYREVHPQIGRADLFWISEGESTQKSLSARKESSYLGIIAAMRALLLDKDGGGFPSQAKVIELLEERYRFPGVSKRNLEAVFADVARALNGDAKAKR